MANLIELNNAKHMFEREAAGLGDYTALTPEQLAAIYLKAEEENDEVVRGQSWSALMLRYWFYIYQWMGNSQSLHLEPEDFVTWLTDCMHYTFRKRVWVTPGHVLFEDPNGFDKALKQRCGSKRAEEYQRANMGCRKGSYNTLSIDAMVEEAGDAATAQVEAVTVDDNHDGDRLIATIVHDFLNKEMGIEALIIDGLCYQDTFKETKTTETMMAYDEETGEEYEDEYTSYHSEFSERRLVKHLTEIDEEFFTKYFCPTYEVSMEEASAILAKLKSTNNQKLYKKIAYTFQSLRNSPIIKELVS